MSETVKVTETAINEREMALGRMIAGLVIEHMSGATPLSDGLKEENEKLKKALNEANEEYISLKKAFDELLKEKEELIRNAEGLNAEQIQEYKFLAYHDRKIGVKNKNSFNREARDLDTSVHSLVMIDISDMRKKNAVSRNTADKAVKEVADALKENFGKKGEVYRLIGDEFAVIAKEGKEDCEETLLNALKRLEKDSISFSYGISEGSKGKTIGSMISEAEEYLGGMKKLKGMPEEERNKLMELKENVIPKSTIVEKRESRMLAVDFDEDDDEQFADMLAGE